uniref:Protein kinase domain-containing protein n=1 Tax=Glossina pallidipes TaxID=7398 RepID=A0A1B0A1I1_GLOPL
MKRDFNKAKRSKKRKQISQHALNMFYAHVTRESTAAPSSTWHDTLPFPYALAGGTMPEYRKGQSIAMIEEFEMKSMSKWMAIESLYDNIFSTESDIWSFGILMWEIVTLGSTPYPGISAAEVMRKVRDGYRLEKPEHCRRELYNIMFYCWAENRHERPTFGEIVQMLDKLLHTEMDYVELERFPDHNYYNIVNVSGEKV